MSWDQYLFGFRGRINRARYWLFAGVTVLLVFALLALIAVLQAVGISIKAGSPGAGSNLLAIGLIIAAFGCAFVISSLAVTIKRLHDRNKSGWWILVFQVLPLCLDLVARASSHGSPPDSVGGAVYGLIAFAISIWAFIEIGCLRGTEGPNRYGPDPLADPQRTSAAFA